MMQKQYTVFRGQQRIAAGQLTHVALAVKEFFKNDPVEGILIFDDEKCHLTEIDFRGSASDVVNRLQATPDTQDSLVEQSMPEVSATRGPGRPKLGVVAREVTLLPRHWDWLNQQTGGASGALRKLVDEARRASVDKDRIRLAQEASYRFMSATLSSTDQFEEAARALFAQDRERFNELIAPWPTDLSVYLAKVAAPVFQRDPLPTDQKSDAPGLNISTDLAIHA